MTVALIRDPFDLAVPLEPVSTDEAGMAVFPAPRAGLFSVCARGAGHAEACEEEVGLVAGGTLSVELRLPPGAAVAGQVLQPDGSPASGVRLVAEGEHWPQERMPTQAMTDAEGRFRLEGVTPGGLRVTPFTPEGRGNVRTVREVKEGAQASLDVRLAGFAPVTVHPVGTRGTAREVVMESVSVSGPLRLQQEGSWTGTAEAGKQTVHVRALREGLFVQGWKEVTLSPGVPSVIVVRRLALQPAGWPLHRGRPRARGAHPGSGAEPRALHHPCA